MCNQIEGAAYEMIPFPQDRKVIDVGDFICDYSTFSKTFGWQPKITFEEGIVEVSDYFRDEIEYYIYDEKQMIPFSRSLASYQAHKKEIDQSFNQTSA